MTFAPSPDICARCAAQGRTCCSVEAGNEEYCFPISIQEMAAIHSAGFMGEDIFVEVANTSGFVDQMTTLMPGYDIRTAFPDDGRHWRLGVSRQGDCVFLGQTGCVLDRTIRPFYCQLFPLWIYQGQLTWFTAEECLANAECFSLAAMLGAMGTESDAARKLFQNMYQALRLEKK